MENETQEYEPQGVPSNIFHIVVVLLIIAVVGDLYLLSTAAAGKASEVAQRAAADQQKTALIFQEKQQKAIFDIEIKIAEVCVQRGGSPQFLNGNVCPATK